MRSRNGWIDDGTPLRQSIGEVCPNCKSTNYVETLSREYCPDCGLECDYWGSGANEVYQEMMKENARIEKEERVMLDDDDNDPYRNIFI